MIPSAFASEKLLARINVLAVGATLAAGTAVAFGASHFASGWAVGIPTLVIGSLWAALLRRPSTVGATSIRWGWIFSVPLAALNAGLACAGLFLSEPSHEIVWPIIGGIVVGATFGIFIWAPALIATIILFGLPIAWAQAQAKRGLAGTERGERVVGLACTVLAIASLVVALVTGRPEGSWMDPTLASGWDFSLALGVLGTALGAASFALSTWRERRRRAFIASVESGEAHHPGTHGGTVQFRVEDTPEGKVLLRVERQGAGAYRVADLEEEICRLDEEGRATDVNARALHLQR